MLLPQLVVLSALLTLVSSLPWSNLLERQEASSSALNDIPTINLVYNCTVAGHFALTFDDGPYLWEKTVGDAFTAGNQLTTFFLNGNNYGCIYDSADIVKELYDANHTMASHGWGHLNMGLLDADAINSELERLEMAFTRILGVVPRFFRPPFGSYSTLLLEILAQRGYTHVYLWDTDSQDADGATASVQSQLFDTNCATYPLSHLALQHSPVEQTITTVLPYALAELRKTRYTVSTVEDCLGLRKEDAYRVVGTPGTRDATWTCA